VNEKNEKVFQSTINLVTTLIVLFMASFHPRMTDYAKEVKAHYTTPFSYVLALMGLVNAYIYYKLNASILVWACAISGTLALPVRFFENKIKNHVLQANYIIVLFCTCITFIAFYTGAVHSNAIWWLGTIPLLASFLLNAFFGVVWFIIIIAIFFAALMLEANGLVPVNILSSADMTGRIIISFSLNSSLIFILCILTELIRDKAFEDKEELSAKAFQLNQLASLGKLASGVAHEINNPLTVIRGAQLRIARQIEKGDELDKGLLSDYMEKIQKNVSRIQEVTGLMRSISSNAANRTISDIDINKIISDVIQMFSEEIQQGHIEFMTELPREHIIFRGIYTEMFQAFFNIIENAVYELMETKQERKIIKIRIDKTADSIVAIINDNGRGISPLVRDHIFDPFFTTKTVGRGRGLGLSFSYNVFTSNGGTLELVEADNGSLFRIVLPLKEIKVPNA